MTSFRIRPGTPADLPRLTDVFVRASLSNQGDREALLAHPEALVLQSDSVAEGRTRVAMQADDIRGFATTLLVEDVLDLQDLFVDPDWMRHGVGRRLVQDAVAIARRRGIERIVVTANPHALPFYDSVGFLRDGEVQTRFGAGLRMHLMVNLDRV
jgi:GNAT superfamily N-acetyltransferase